MTDKPDKYDAIRSLDFPSLAGGLGLDIQKFKRRKNEWAGPCPIHGSQNNTNCFSYNDDGRFNCFSQGCHGKGAIDFCKLLLNIGFKEAVEKLGGIKPSPAAQTPATDEKTARSGPLEKDSWRKYAQPCEWLAKRISDPAILERYGVFFYENKSRRSQFNQMVMLPFRHHETGQLWGYMGRNIGEVTQDRPKYRIPPGLAKSAFLFGAFELPEKPVRVLYAVESPFAAMKFALLGLPAIALYGWSVAPEQVATLVQLARGVVYIPDRNKYSEAQHCLPTLAERLWVRMPTLPEGIDDPEHLPNREAVLALTQG